MKTIVWDIDDVLNDSTKVWLETNWLPFHPDCTLKYENLTENPPHGLLGIKREEYLNSLDKFRLSSQAQAMIPDLHLMNWFKENGIRFRHVALTARPRKTVSPAIDWVLRYYSEWFQTFSFVPAERDGESPSHPDHNKGDFLLWLGRADYFIDDHPGNIITASKLGIKAFLVARPWNSGGFTLEDIVETGLKE
jgi:phosphoglycolate phosphatase-like HAD superfamily hydrolase